MIRLGVSVYPEQETLEEIDQYLRLASAYGFTKVFTSMFSVPGTKEEVFVYFKTFTEIAHAYGMIVSGDCNVEFFRKMNASEHNLSVFKEMGIDILRMDSCYMDERDVTLIHNMEGIGIELSAAFMGPIMKAIQNGADPKKFSACHNFYPQRYTGASCAKIKAVNAQLKELGLSCSIFISSNVEAAHGPWPVQNGLPTIEDHRWMYADLQLKHLLAMGDVDEVIFGNAFASEEEFQMIDAVMKAAYIEVPRQDSLGMAAQYIPFGNLKRIPFHIILEKGVSDVEQEITFDYPSHQVSEYTYYMLRSRWPRFFYKQQELPVRLVDKAVYSPGDVVIVNDNLSYYHAELQIVLREMRNDGQRNLIGHISEEEVFLLEEMNNGDFFCFQK